MHNLIIEPDLEDSYVKLAYLLNAYTDKYYNALSKTFKETNKEKIIKLLMCLCLIKI